jgi:preprotein translocase subunit YajC
MIIPSAATLSTLSALAPFLQDEEGGGGSLLGSSLFPLLLIGVIFWFVVLGPERKNRKKREVMIAALKKGDEVMTNSGLYGRIVQIKGEQVTLQVDDKVRLRFARVAIQGLVNPEKAEERAEADAGEPDAGEGETVEAGNAAKES